MGNIDIRFYLSIFRRRLPYFILIAAVVAGLGTVVAALLPPSYQAHARILVEAPQISTSLVRPTVPDEMVKQLQTIELQMMTRANLLALANRFGLYRDMPDATDSDIVDDMRARMSMEQVQLDGPRGQESALAFVVSYKAKDPVLAADVVNAFVNLLLQKNVAFRTEQASQTLQFFQQETERLGAKLTQVEGELSAFKKENRDALPESLSFRRSQQLSQQERLLQLGREEASLRDGRARLVQMYASTGRIGNAAQTPEEQTLEQLRKVLVEQRTIYADTSPGILALQAQIAALEKAAKAKRAGGEAVGGKALPPELDMQLADINRRLTLLADEKAAIGQTLAELTRSIAATPGNEATLNALERQYQNVQAQYNAAVTRLAEASAGDRIEQRAKGERLSVLDFATPPQRPIGPKRLAIAAGSAFAGVLLGLGFVVLLEFLNKTIRRPAELVETLAIEPLVTIPYIPARGATNAAGSRLIPAALRRLSGT